MESTIGEPSYPKTAKAAIPPPLCHKQCPLAILDSGASCHISSCRELFISMRPCTHVMTGVGSQKLQATGVGTMRFVCTHEKGWYILDLEGALFVPESRITLVSTSLLLKQYGTASVTFTASGGTVVLSKTQRISLYNVHGLYAFDLWHDSPCYKPRGDAAASEKSESAVSEPQARPWSPTTSKSSHSKRHYHHL